MDEFNHLLSKKNAERQMPRKQSSLDQISNNIRRLYIKCYDAEPDDVTQIEGMVNGMKSFNEQLERSTTRLL